MKNFGKYITMGLLALVLIVSSGCDTEASAVDDIKLVVDGKDITHLTEPIIENGRTLVPIRFVTEEIGGEVSWDNSTRTVRAWKGDRSLRMVIGSKAVELGNGQDSVVSDVAPRIIADRTFVPLRLISNGLGIQVQWDNATRTVLVDSGKTASVEPFFNIDITSPQPGSILTGKTRFSLSGDSQLLKAGNQIRLILLDKSNHTGFIVGRADASMKAVEFIPEMEQNGDKLLVAAVYDSSGGFLGADSIPVSIRIIPDLGITGIEDNMVISSGIKLSPVVNFAPHSVKYVIRNQASGKVTVIDGHDPFGSYTWNPMSSERGLHTVQLVAKDHTMNEFPGKIYTVNIQVPQRLTLSGVTAGMTIRNPVTLLANRNFDVRETQFIMKDPTSGMETIIQTIPYGSYTWFPGPGVSGSKDLLVRVVDASGATVTSDPVRVNIDGSPRLQLQGIGPKQVVTADTELTYRTNAQISNVEFVLTNRTSGVTRTIKADPATGKGTFVLQTQDTGDWRILVRGTYNGTSLSSETVDFKVYTKKIFGPQSIVAKDQFKSFASNMAVESYRKTGMSAAIQTAQAILETGWGQFVPVDKYSGKPSNNLFGIKGSASNGSVISNTWEVYNGVTYRVDAEFRAYKDVKESWNDHKILLEKERYEIFRDVMYSSTMGSWAIRRAGYATDPQYPIKLMDIIKTNNLRELDRIGF